MSLFGNILGGVLGFASSKSGGKSTQTESKAPWEPAQPWIQDTINSGRALQQQYLQNPFSPLQMNAFANQFAASQRGRAMVPDLQRQMSMQRQFDRSNPTMRPTQYNFGSAVTPQESAATGLGGAGSLAGVTSGVYTPPAASAAPAGSPFGFANAFPEIGGNDGRQPAAGGQFSYGAPVGLPALPGFMSALSPAFASAYNSLRDAAIAQQVKSEAEYDMMDRAGNAGIGGDGGWGGYGSNADGYGGGDAGFGNGKAW